MDSGHDHHSSYRQQWLPSSELFLRNMTYHSKCLTQHQQAKARISILGYQGRFFLHLLMGLPCNSMLKMCSNSSCLWITGNSSYMFHLIVAKNKRNCGVRVSSHSSYTRRASQTSIFSYRSDNDPSQYLLCIRLKKRVHNIPVEILRELKAKKHFMCSSHNRFNCAPGLSRGSDHQFLMPTRCVQMARMILDGSQATRIQADAQRTFTGLYQSSWAQICSQLAAKEYKRPLIQYTLHICCRVAPSSLSI